MFDPELIKDSVLAILEEKAERLKSEKDFKEKGSAVFELSIYNDIKKTNSVLGAFVGVPDVGAALESIEQETNGRFKRIAEPKEEHFISINKNKPPTSILKDQHVDFSWVIKFQDIKYTKRGVIPKNSGNPFIFYISQGGRLSRILDHGEEYHQFGDGTKLDILLNFAHKKAVIPNNFDRGNKMHSANYIRDEVRELRKVIEKKFRGVDSMEFIPTPKGKNKGYKLGTKFRIISVSK